jgi:hypothetical protein
LRYKPFRGIQLVIQLALHKNPLATIELRRRQKLAAGVGVDAQEVSDLVWSPQWWNDEGNDRPERK